MLSAAARTTLYIGVYLCRDVARSKRAFTLRWVKWAVKPFRADRRNRGEIAGRKERMCRIGEPNGKLEAGGWRKTRVAFSSHQHQASSLRLAKSSCQEV